LEDDCSRESLVFKAVGNVYLDMWTNTMAAVYNSLGDGLRGSRLTELCRASVPHGGNVQPSSMRRYVINEKVESIDVMRAFNSLENYPDSHDIRVEEGKVKYVHTINV
jgi:hypothetical protein